MGLPKRFIDKVDITNGCHNWKAYKNHNGYGMFPVNGRPSRAHRFAWESKYGKIPKGLYVLHKCDNRACVNIDHLFLGTHKDNMNDMRIKKRGKGRSSGKRGEEHLQAKLNWDEVRQIRNLYIKGSREFGSTGLSKKFKISKTQIKRIIKNKSWEE